MYGISAQIAQTIFREVRMSNDMPKEPTKKNYKAALDEITMAIAKDSAAPKKIKRDIITMHTLLKNIFVIMDALRVAQEVEQTEQK